MKYQKRLQWDRYRPEFLKIGFIFSLAIVLMAFNYTTNAPREIIPYEVEPLGPDIILTPPTTTHQREVLPPPPPEKIDVVNIEPTTEPIIEFVEKVEVVDKVEPVVDVYASEPQPEKAPIVELIKEESGSDGPLIRAESMPIYGDCDVEEEERIKNNCTNSNLINHIYENVKYPSEARRIQIEGTVVVSFVVDKMGNVEDIKIVRDIGVGCGDAVLKAMKKLGKFIPGKQNGRPVSIIYRVPVKFKLH